MIRMLKPPQIILLIILLTVHFVSFAQGKIIMNGAAMNMKNSAYVVTNDVSLTSASTLNVSNSTIKIAGIITNNSGVFDVDSGTVEMNGTILQTIPVSAFFTNKIQHLIVSNNVVLAGEDSITDVLSFGSSNKDFLSNGLLTLKSTAVNTARLADITNGGTASGNTVTGNVHVERFIQARRAWRLLSAPIAGTQTINSAWQEGQVITNTLPGFGTHITGGSVANGFDQGVNLNPSIKIFSGGAWVGVSNTNATPITNQAGYMLFPRGDRSVNLSQGIYATPTNTVLRSTGSLKLNNQSFAVSATGFTVVGNPYASPMNLMQIAKLNSSNIQDVFYLWDPKITGTNGVGGYVTLSWSGSAYDITPASPSGLNQYIQSGSAFLAKTSDNTNSGTLIIKEIDKTTAASLNVNRPVNNSTGKIATNLYSFNSDGTTSIVDGVLNSYADMYSNSLDKYDAVKIKNFSESLSTQRDGKSLVVERKQLITEADTIFLNMLQMKAKSYKFEIVADNFNTAGLTGFLEDSYVNTNTPLSLAGTTIYNFNVINVPGSWNPNRFRIVFKAAEVLPVTFNSINAFKLEDNIEVEWHASNEINIRQYDLEKSVNGQQFTRAVIVAPTQNNNSASVYNWLDEKPFKGNNFYRIKSVSDNGRIQYSSIVKVFIDNDKKGIIVPASQPDNGVINFTFVNMPAGDYKVRLLTSLGQLLAAKKIEHKQGTSTENIQLISNAAKDIYMLEIIQPDNKRRTYKILLY